MTNNEDDKKKKLNKKREKDNINPRKLKSIL